MSAKDKLNKQLQGIQPVTDQPVKLSAKDKFNITLSTEMNMRSIGLSPVGGITPVGNTGIGSSQYDFRIPEAEIDNLNLIRANRQGGGAQAFNSTIRGVASGLLTAIEDISYILDFDNNIKRLQGIENVESNAVAEWMKEGKEYLREALPVYRKRPDQTFDFKDSGFYWDMWAGILDSAVGFGAVGMGAGALVKGVGAGLRALSTAGNISRAEKLRAYTNLLGTGLQEGALGNLTAGYITNYGESKMMALELYEDAKANTLESLVNDYRVKNGGADPTQDQLLQFEKTASSIAGERADTFMLQNKMFALTDAWQLKGIFKGVPTTRDIVKKPSKAFVSSGFWKDQAKQAPKEAFEEIGQNVLQMEGKYQAEQTLAGMGVSIKDPISQTNDLVNRIIEFGTSDQALLEGAMGLFSGPIQYGVTTAPFTNTADTKKRYSDQQATIEKNKEFFRTKTKLTAARADAKQQAKDLGMEPLADLMSNQEFDQLAIENFARGTTENLETMLQESLESDEYTDVEKEAIKSKLDRLGQLETKFTEFNKYANSHEVMQNRVTAENIQETAKLSSLNAQQTLETITSTYEPILERYNKTAKDENKITVADLRNAFESIDYTKLRQALAKEPNATPERVMEMLEQTQPQAFEILNRRDKTKQSLLNNPLTKVLIQQNVASDGLTETLETLEDNFVEMTQTPYQLGYQRLDNIRKNIRMSSDEKVDALNKLENDLSGTKNKAIINLVKNERAGLENLIQKSKENKGLVTDPATEVAQTEVKDAKNKVRQTPQGSFENVDESELPVTEEIPAEELTQAQPETLSEEELNDIKEYQNNLFALALDGQGDLSPSEVMNLSPEDIQAIRDAKTPEEIDLEVSIAEEVKALRQEEAVELDAEDVEVIRAFQQPEVTSEDIAEVQAVLESQPQQTKPKPNKKEAQELIVVANKAVDPIQVEVQSLESLSSTTNKDTATVQGKSEMKSGDKGVKIVMQYATPALKDWLMNPVDKTGTKVNMVIDFDNRIGNSPRALNIFSRKKAGKKITPQEEEFMEQNLPIKMQVNNDPNLSTFIYTATTNNPYEIEIRKQIINNLLQDIPAETVIDGQYGGELKVTDSDTSIMNIPGILDNLPNNNIINLPIYMVGNDAKIRIGSAPDQTFGEISTKKHHEVEVRYKHVKGNPPMAGALFIDVPKANGESFPLKLNIESFSDNEVQGLVALLTAVTTYTPASQPNFWKRTITDQTMVTLPNGQQVPLLSYFRKSDIDFLKDSEDGLTYNSLMRFLVHEGENTASNPVTQFFVKDGKVIFGDQVLTHNDMVQGKVDKIKALVDFFSLYKTRNVDLKRMNKDGRYKEHLLTSGILTTNTDTTGNSLFESLNLQEAYKGSVKDRTENRFREGAVYLKPNLTNPAPAFKTKTENAPAQPVGEGADNQVQVGARVVDNDGVEYEVLELTTSRKGTPQAVVKLPKLTEEEIQQKARFTVFGRDEARLLYKDENDPEFLKEKSIAIKQEIQDIKAINSGNRSMSIDLSELKPLNKPQQNEVQQPVKESKITINTTQPTQQMAEKINNEVEEIIPTSTVVNPTTNVDPDAVAKATANLAAQFEDDINEDMDDINCTTGKKGGKK